MHLYCNVTVSIAIYVHIVFIEPLLTYKVMFIFTITIFVLVIDFNICLTTFAMTSLFVKYAQHYLIIVELCNYPTLKVRGVMEHPIGHFITPLCGEAKHPRKPHKNGSYSTQKVFMKHLSFYSV